MEWIVNDRLDERALKESHSALNWGLLFSFAQLKELLIFAAFPCLVKLLAAYLLYFEHFALKERLFVTYVVTAFADCWLLVVVLLFLISRNRGEYVSRIELASRALINLPKPLLSYVLTSVLVLAGLPLIFPGLMLFALFAWAPAFCIGELFGAHRSDEVLSNDEEFFSLDGADEKERQRSFFSYKEIWELGFQRSLFAARGQLQSAFYLFLLILASVVLPLTASDLLMPRDAEFFNLSLRIFFSSFLNAIVTGVWAGSFLVILPQRAREELGVSSLADYGSMLPERLRKNLSLERNFKVQLMLLVIIGGASWYDYRQLREESRFSTSAQLTLLSSESKNGELHLVVQLQDPKRKLIWLQPQRFELLLKLSSFGAEQTNVSQERLKLSRFNAFDENGVFLAADSYLAMRQTIRLMLSFPLPLLEAGKSYQYSLIYRPDIGPQPMLAEGRVDFSNP